MMEQTPQPEEPDSRSKWFKWQDLLLPIAPGVLCVGLFFYTWHPLFLVVGLAFLAAQGVIIGWRLGKLK
jgi:hypothetical protein